jgi:UDP-glucose 4-epimerase
VGDRILITGATGFVGRHFVSHLLTTSDRTMTLALRHASQCQSEWQDNVRIRLAETGPIETSTALDSALSDVSDVVHLAGLAHAPRTRGAAPFAAANTSATQRLTEAASRHGIRSFIHLSSLAAITKNASEVPVDDTTFDPTGMPYGASKHDAERSVEPLAHQGILAVSLRPPLVVGPDARGNWAALQKLASTGLPLPLASVRNKRSLIGIKNLVDALSLLSSGAFGADHSGNYCIADDDPMSLVDIVSLLREGMGLPPSLLPFPPTILTMLAGLAGRGQMANGLFGDLAVDAHRFNAVFGFKPRQSLAQAIQESGALYYMKNISRPQTT